MIPSSRAVTVVELRENSGWPEGKLSAQQLDLILRDLEGLPTFASVLGRLLELTKDTPPLSPRHDATITEAARLIRCDPSLTMNFLCHANRSQRETVRTVEHAVKKLGLEAVRAIALSTKVFDSGAEPSPIDSGLDRGGFWRHCLAVAAASQMLTEQLSLPIEPEEAYVCGLLHDMGKLGLEQCFPKSYARILEALETRSGNIAECERKIIGVDHTVVGRRLAQIGGLPEEVGWVAWLHHQPLQGIPQSLDDRRLVPVVALADTIAREQRLGFSGNYTFPHPSEQMGRELGLTAESLREVVDRLPGETRKLYELLAPEEPNGEEAYHHAITESQTQVPRVNEELRKETSLLRMQAQGFKELRDLVTSVGGNVTVPEVLLEIAKVAASVGGCTPTRTAPVVAYSLAADGEILALRWTGSGAPSYRTAVRAARKPPVQLDGSVKPASGMLNSLLEDASEFNDWLDVSTYMHRALVCGGTWIGGVLYPEGKAEGDVGDGEETRKDLAAVLGMVLGTVQARSKAVQLSEQLTGASQALADAQESLTETKALSGLREMATGAAHELNNPLAIISGRAQLMRKKTRDEEQRKTWELIAEQAQRISNIITELMEFASPPTPNLRALDVGGLFAEAVRAFSSSDHPKDPSVRVDINLGEDVPPVLGDKSQIHAVIVELITNAASAATAAPHITLSAHSDTVTGKVLLSAADDGPGMDRETVANVFAPFFSSQQAGRRRGLGLPRAKRYVENNGGRIWIRSTPNEGTVVYVELPSAPVGAGGEGKTDV